MKKITTLAICFITAFSFAQNKPSAAWTITPPSSIILGESLELEATWDAGTNATIHNVNKVQFNLQLFDANSPKKNKYEWLMGLQDKESSGKKSGKSTKTLLIKKDLKPSSELAEGQHYAIRLTFRTSENIWFSLTEKIKIVNAPSWLLNFEGKVPKLEGKKATAKVVKNPSKSGINSSNKVLKVTVPKGTFEWEVPYMLGTKIKFNDKNGKYLKFKFLTTSNPNVTIKLVPWLDGWSKEFAYEEGPTTATFSDLELNTWYEAEVFMGNIENKKGKFPTPGVCNRLDFNINNTNKKQKQEEIIYFDDFELRQTSTL